MEEETKLELQHQILQQMEEIYKIYMEAQIRVAMFKKVML